MGQCPFTAFYYFVFGLSGLANPTNPLVDSCPFYRFLCVFGVKWKNPMEVVVNWFFGTAGVRLSFFEGLILAKSI